MPETLSYDAVVIGGGPSGAIAAEELAQAGWSVALIDRAGRVKPCGGAVPPRLIRDFKIPDELLVAKIRCARMISPSRQQVDIPIDNGFVGMVNRGEFDEYLRGRAAQAGAKRLVGQFSRIYAPDGSPERRLEVELQGPSGPPVRQTIRARLVIGADGAKSQVAKQCVPGADRGKTVFAYHEILRRPDHQMAQQSDYDPDRCDVYYQGDVSPDFYGWMFPHGNCLSIGTGSMDKGFSLRSATGLLKQRAGLDQCELLRKEGAPIPLKPLPQWDDGHHVVLAGDAAGVVAPASGEGIYYAMLGGQLAAQAGMAFLESGNVRDLRLARSRFMKAHGRVFFILGLLQRFWYQTDKRREQFVKICKDKDVQQLTFDAYMNKELV
ncbi:MAG: geranylgeranyl diphosphate reductase, partial [Burkholderiaceae bacterium]